MSRSPNPRFRRLTAVAGQVIGIVAALTLGVAVLGSCSGERPSLGAIAPTTSTTATTAPEATTTTTAPEVVRARVLGTEDLRGWIATPVASPVVYAEPSTDAERIDIGDKTAAGAPTTFAVIGDASPEATAPVDGWLEVALPTRPNASTGWVTDDSVTLTKTPFRLFVDLDGRTLRVEEDGTEVYNSDVAIGTAENPTPVNGTFVTELIANNEPEGAYGPFAFGLAMHSDTLTEFNGGPGQVGIHGTNRPELIGDAVSHGCVRLTNEDIQDLVDLQLPLGVPVFVT